MSAGAVLLREAEQLADGLGAVGGRCRYEGELADQPTPDEMRTDTMPKAVKDDVPVVTRA